MFVAFDAMLNGDFHRVFEQRADFPLKRADLVDWARRSADDLFCRFSERCGKRRWAEKTPAHVYHIRLINEVFPRAQFIHSRRNGYGVVRSLRSMSWAPRRKLRRIRWSARTWTESVRAGQAAGKELASDRYLELRYEALLSDTEPVLRGVCEFLREPFAPEMLQFHKPENNTWHVCLKPLEREPAARHPELDWVEAAVFNWMARPMMRELGYAAKRRVR